MKRELDRVEENGCLRTAIYKEAPETEIAFKDKNKQDLLEAVVVVTTSGKSFYADPVSRADISDAIAIAQELGQTETAWKLTTGIEVVTLAEMQEVRLLGLQAKGSIVGV